jgi:diguanylate cyclase (GGDEF)-like protein/PAS domain S-box-containing protein
MPNSIRSLLVVGLLAALAIVAVTANEIRLGRERVVDEAERGLAAATLSLAEQLRRDMQAIGLVMEDARTLAAGHDLSKPGIGAILHPTLRNMALGLPILNNLLLISPAGIVVAGNLTPDQPTVSATDRPYFAYHRDNAFLQMHIGESNISRTTGFRVLQITQRINGANGEFGGIVLVSLRHDYLASMFGSFVPAEGGAVAMLRRDGKLLAHFPVPDDKVFENDFRDNRLFTAYLPRQPFGTYLNMSAIDGQPRYFSYRMVGDLPVVVNVSQLEDAVLGPWHKMLARQLAMALLAVASMAGLISFLIRQLYREERQTRALAASETRFRTLFASAADALFLVQTDGTVVKANDQACSSLGYLPEELTGQPITSLLVQPDEATVLRALRGGHAAHSLDGLLRCRDGKDIAVEVRLSQVDWDDTPLVLCLVRDVSVRRAYQAELERLASHDELTRVPKRALFFDRLTQAIALAKRAERMVGVLFVDLDRFKQVNDTLGHVAGDELLRQGVARMLAALRQIDSVGRYGGDEFVVLLPEIASEESIMMVAAKLCGVFNTPFDLDGREATISTSIGVAVFPRDGENAEAQVHHADQAMYAAKTAGGNRVCQYAAA